MRRRPFRHLVTLLGMLAVGTAHGQTLAMSTQEAEQAAPLVAAMLLAGQDVVGDHQNLINESAEGDKGFTPAYVEVLMREEFEEIVGRAVRAVGPAPVRNALEATVQASNQALRHNQARINAKGEDLERFLPVTYGRVMAGILKDRCGIEIKQTSLAYRHRSNRPDAFEERILHRFEDQLPKDGYGEVVGDTYRYMQPIYIRRSCLKCHGEPAGEFDVGGDEKEGYMLGDLRGAISVKIPVGH